MTRPKMSVHLVFIAACVVATVLAAESVAQEAPAEVARGGIEISWLASCADTAEKFFSLHVSDAGAVRYQGHEGVKTVGAVQAQISRSAAKRIRARATSFVASTKQRTKNPEPERGTFCLSVRISAKNGVVDSRAERSDARSTATMLREIDRQVGPKQWACPARKVEPLQFHATRYCAEQWAFALTIGGRTSCDLTQDIQVYVDGTLYSLAYRTHGTFTPQDSFYKIDPAAVSEMVDLINTFETATMEFEEFPPGTQTTLYFRARPEDVETIRARLGALAPIEWMASHDAKGCDEFPGPKSTILLRPDLDRAATKKSTR